MDSGERFHGRVWVAWPDMRFLNPVRRKIHWSHSTKGTGLFDGKIDAMTGGQWVLRSSVRSTYDSFYLCETSHPIANPCLEIVELPGEAIDWALESMRTFVSA